MDYNTESLILHFITQDDLAEAARTWPSDHHPLTDKEAREIIGNMQSNYEKNRKGRIHHLCLAVCGKDHPALSWAGQKNEKAYRCKISSEKNRYIFFQLAELKDV